MAKMSDVRYGVPENFLSGVGQYSYEDMLMDAALGFAAASDDDILMGLSGLGRMAMPGQTFNLFVKMNDAQLRAFVAKNPMNTQARQELARRVARKPPPGKPNLFPMPSNRITNFPMPPPGRPNVRPMPPPGKPNSVMDAIIKNAKEINAKKALVEKTKVKAAAASPIVAIALAKKKQQTSMPGASETRGIITAANQAAKKAMLAKKDEAAAKRLLAQSDKRGAAAKAVSAMTKAREAAIIANKAEKTRLTRALDILANTLKAQADYLEQLVKMETTRSGQSPRSMALMATAQTLRQQVTRIKAQSGAVAAMPNVPANAPSQQRIADLANKFNIRTASKDKYMDNRAVISVLGDLAENPMAQVTDYEGALSYYGVDGLGKLMADIEFSNYDDAFAGLAGQVHGIGYTDTTPILAQGDTVVDAATALATTTYNEVIVPAAGLGALGGEWEDWCDREVPANKATAVGKAYKGDVAKCKKFGLGHPQTIPGIISRGGDVDIIKAVTDIPKAIAKAASDVKKTAADVKQVTGGTAAPPPAAAKPPTPVPAPAVTVEEKKIQEQATGSSSSALTTTADTAAPAKSNTVMYVGIGAAVLAVGGAAYWFLMRPKAAPAAI